MSDFRPSFLMTPLRTPRPNVCFHHACVIGTMGKDDRHRKRKHAGNPSSEQAVYKTPTRGEHDSSDDSFSPSDVASDSDVEVLGTQKPTTPAPAPLSPGPARKAS